MQPPRGHCAEPPADGLGERRERDQGAGLGLDRLAVLEPAQPRRRQPAQAVPAPVLSASLYTRFRSRLEHSFGEKVLSAMRHKFGGHVERATGG